MNEAVFASMPLDERHVLHVGRLPAELLPSEETWQTLWDLHPAEFHVIHMPGGPVATPRWQQAYGRDYHYTGRTNRAAPIPLELLPLTSWCQSEIDPRLNGVLLNWYEGQQGHYIGRHRDSVVNLAADSPIVTISLGEERVFRLRPWRAKGMRDFPARHGAVFVMPYATNLAWTHEVPHRRRYRGRRISVTLRAFMDEGAVS